jgi:tetratricopeptide (TPR) repeat protein
MRWFTVVSFAAASFSSWFQGATANDVANRLLLDEVRGWYGQPGLSRQDGFMPAPKSVSQLLERVGLTTSAFRRNDSASQPSTRTPFEPPPQLPSRFRIESRLGEGGMGIVYRVYDAELGQDVALKSIHRLRPSDLYFLKNEFRSLADIRHPNLVELYELHVGEHGECFITMELIRGSDFITYVRGAESGDGASCNVERLQDAATQLAQAITAIHRAGKLHRDIKPSNILVTPAGRVVLLDFGLVEDVGPQGLTPGTRGFLGTPAYMSPEQVRGERLTAAADWYSFALTVFEAATGQLPSERPYERLSRRRSDDAAARIRALSPDVPDEFAQLTARLLHGEARERPSDEVILAALTHGSLPRDGAGSVPPSMSFVVAQLFGDRAQEMQRLRDALATVKEGQTITVHVHGASGIGKTELLRRFTEEAVGDGAELLVGRCHPQESIPFNALDGMVDALSDLLDAAPLEQLQAWLPEHVGTLPRLFPVLGRVTAIAAASGRVPEEPGIEILRRAARALKALLWSIGASRPLIVWLDDVQWGDEDSGRLLREVMAPPDVPRLLLVLSYRSEDREESRTLGALDSGVRRFASTTVDLPLSPLSEEDTIALVRQAVGVPVPDPEAFRQLVQETAGLPFFVQELTRYLTTNPAGLGEQSRIGLQDLLARRMEPLPRPMRDLLELVAVAGSPVEQRYLLRAAGLDEASRPLLAELERVYLVRSATLTPDRRTEIYHHKIRDVVLGMVDRSTKEHHHRALATAMLTAAQPNLPRIVDHFDAAGDVASSRKYVFAAARQAAAALAFDRAAKLYRRAIELGSTDLDLASLHERLGEASANAGLGREAGATFERAAEIAKAADAPGAQLLSLRRRAAEQYLKSWQRADAMRVLQGVLPELGIRMPFGLPGALAETVANRARAIVLRHAVRVGPTRVVTPQVRQRLEVLQTLMLVYGMTEPLIGFAFGSRMYLEALGSGDSDFIFRALAYEATSWSVMRNAFAQHQVDRHLAWLSELRKDTDRPDLVAIYYTACGYSQQFRGHFSAAENFLEQALAEHPKMRRRATVEYANALAFYLPGLAFLGRLGELRRILDREIADAEARGDDYLPATCAAGHPSLGWIVGGREAIARTWADRVLAVAPPGFSTQHYCNVVAMAHIELYAGRGIVASAIVERLWPLAARNRYLDIALIGDDLRQTRARAALGAAVELGRTRGSPFERHCAVALAEAGEIERHGLPFAKGWAELLRAGVDALAGRHASAELALERALPSLTLSGLALYAAAANYALGRMSGRRRALADSAERWFADAGVIDPVAATRMLAPGCIE